MKINVLGYFKNSIIVPLFLNYRKIAPIQRGLFRLAVLLDSVIGPFNVSTKDGILLSDFKLSSSMDLSYLETKNESHQKVLEVIDSLGEGDIFFDIGANIGYFSLIASRRVGTTGRIYSFEPSPREYIRLLKNLEINHVSNVIPYNLALSDRLEESSFYLAEYHTGLNVLKSQDDSPKSESLAGREIQVPTIRGDSLLDIPFLKNISARMAAKIDVEGAELLVLKGFHDLLQLPTLETVVVEITPNFLAKFNSTETQIYDLMSQYGFKPTIKIKESSWQFDEIFVR